MQRSPKAQPGRAHSTARRMDLQTDYFRAFLQDAADKWLFRSDDGMVTPEQAANTWALTVESARRRAELAAHAVPRVDALPRVASAG